MDKRLEGVSGNSRALRNPTAHIAHAKRRVAKQVICRLGVEYHRLKVLNYLFTLLIG